MKRFITLIAAVLATALTLSAREASDPMPAQTETKEYHLSGFSGLDINFMYQVELTRSNRYLVTVECPDFLVPYLMVDVRDGNLRLSMNELPRDVRRRMDNGNYKLHAIVHMPELNVVRMSGASKLEAVGEFTTRKVFRANLSGATNASGISIRAAEAEIECSGASKLFLKGEFEKVNASASGSSVIDLDASTRDAKVGLSGASRFDGSGKINKLNVEASGASFFTLNGQLSELVAGGSGAAKIHTDKAPANTARIRLSGASSAVVDVHNEMSVSLSGASSLRYRANDRLRITDQNVSRASSITSFR